LLLLTTGQGLTSSDTALDWQGDGPSRAFWRKPRGVSRLSGAGQRRVRPAEPTSASS
jgi:hypothetical protein